MRSVYRGEMEYMRKQEPIKDVDSEGGERLARFIAHAGVASRRHAEELIAAGRVRVNDIVVTRQGTRIDPAQDRVVVNGQLIESTVEHVYLLVHKPVGYVSTSKDPQKRLTVLDLLPHTLRKLRVYPIGRLDIDTSGLLLLTNDGDFALHLSHPRYSMEKHYEVVIEGQPSEATLDALRKGVVFTEDGGASHKSSPAKVRLVRQKPNETVLALTISEGRKRQIRRMLKAVGHSVLHLARVGVGPLNLNGVPVGKWRYLKESEVETLRKKKIDTE